MELSWNPYALLPALSFVLTLALLLDILRYRVTTTGKYVVTIILSLLLWTGASFVDHLVASFDVKVTLVHLVYIAVASLGPLAVGAGLHLSRRSHWARPRHLVALAVPPAAFLFCAWTNDLHHWVWTSREVAQSSTGPILVSRYGPAFWLHTAYSYALIAMAAALLITHYGSDWRAHRREAPLLLGAIAVPLLANLLSISGTLPMPVDLTSYSISGSMLLAGFALEREGVLNVNRIAPSAVLDEMQDGVLVVDWRDELVYLNLAARRLLDLPTESLPAPAGRCLARYQPILSLLSRGRPGEHTELDIGETTYDIDFALLEGHLGQHDSRVISLQDVTARKRAEQAIELLAYFDPLTRLPNRTHFQRRAADALAAAARENSQLALLFLDLDRFKQVNDTLGHSAGDELLFEVARRIEAAVQRAMKATSREPERSHIARLGGDEFTVMISSLANAREAERFAACILDALRLPFQAAGREIFTGASIGIAIHPRDGADAERLLLAADAAMYEAKSDSRKGFRFYTPASGAAAVRRLELEGRLHHALTRDELRLVFQPVRSVTTGRIEAAEALLRWEDPKLGNIPPSEFIPIAEEAGLIAEVGEWVVDEACRELRHWRDEGYGPVRVMVNLSSRHLRQPGLLAVVEEALARHAIPAELLELEITESSVMHDDEATTRALEGLARMGVGVSLDDFGTGYSSLSNLRRFSFRRLKIDRSFVAGLPHVPDDCAIVEATLAMARSLHLDVIAEGVENEAQARFLIERGCTSLQGYLTGPPVRASVLLPLLAEDAKRDPA